MTSLLSLASLFCLTLSVGLTAYQLARVQPIPTAELGVRGLRRHQALRAGSFRYVEPLVRRVAAWIAHLPLDGLRSRFAEQLRRSGEHLGLTPDEYIAFSLVTGVLAFLASMAVVVSLDAPAVFVVFLTVGGLALPSTRVSAATKQRFQDIARALPAAIDLAALCMGAGQDFPGAIRQVVATSPSREDPLTEELARILQELELGRTRKAALEGFAERAPIPMVRDFVGAVVQAEMKGNPLADVLRIQATVLRLRRSTMLEEAASRSALLMLGPMVLMMLAVMCILLGPMVVTMSQTEL